MPQIVRSHCRICTNQCGIAVTVKGEQIVRVKGDFEHPLSHGYTCPKGRAVGRLHHHDQAIMRPAMRSGEELVDADWDTVLDDLATCLGAVIDAHGPGAVAFYFGSGLGMDAAGFRMGEAFHNALGHPPSSRR